MTFSTFMLIVIIGIVLSLSISFIVHKNVLVSRIFRIITYSLGIIGCIVLLGINSVEKKPTGKTIDKYNGELQQVYVDGFGMCTVEPSVVDKHTGEIIWKYGDPMPQKLEYESKFLFVSYLTYVD